MKDRIPTYTIEINALNEEGVLAPKEVEIYQWIPQSESDTIENALMGDKEQTVGKNNEVTFTIKASAMHVWRKLKVQYYCKNLTPEEFDFLPPVEREKVLAAIDGREEEVDKKK